MSESIATTVFNLKNNTKRHLPLSPFFKKEENWGQRGEVSGPMSHSRMSHDSNSVLTLMPMHKSSINLGGQRLDSWDPDLRGPPKATVPGPTPLFCRERHPEKQG